MRFLGTIFIIALIGCASVGSQNSITPETKDDENISAVDAIVIAEEHLKNINIDYSNYRVKAEWHPDAWWVMYEGVVPKPGGHFIVLVSHDGTILEILPGE